MTILKLFLATCLVSLSVVGAAETELRAIEIRGDVHISEWTEWSAGHYQIHGNLLLEPNGILLITDSLVELMCTYSKEFTCQWNGGTLITKNTTIGGTLRDGAINQCVFEQNGGAWYSTDTTVRYTYGISVNGGKFRAIRLRPGPNPDALHMSGVADVRIEDSEYDIVLRIYPGDRATEATLDLPVKTPVTRVFDPSTLAGITYRLEMVNSTVPNWWFVFFNGLTMDGPPLKIKLNDCPSVVPAVAGYNLKARIRFPSPWAPTEPDGTFPPIQVGNLTVVTTKERQIYWSVYASGEETDLTILGPTQMPELFLWGGKALFLGEAGTFNAQTNATVIDVGHPGHDTPAVLTMRNAAVTVSESSDGYEYGGLIRAQITAQGSGIIHIENAELAPVTLVTKEKGMITLRDIVKKGDIRLVENGGPIIFLGEE